MKRRSEEIYSNITDKDINDIKKKPPVNLRKSLDSSDISKISKISDKILLFNTIHEVFVCENENPSTILISCSNAEIMRKQNTASEIKYMNLEDDFFVDLLKDIKEDEWEYVFSSLTAWLVPTSLMPTIMLRCLFYLILTTNDDFFLKRAVVAITSCLPSYSCGKLFTDQLFLKVEPLEDYPKSVQGKLFNVIMDLFLTALSSENDDEPLCLQKLNICNEQLYKLKLNCDSEDDESDDECENEESDSEYLYDTTKLTKEVQLERIALCVQLLLDFLEVDLMEFLVKFKGNLGLSINVNSWKPLIAKLDNIPYTELFGAINTCNRKDYSDLISKYINLLAEVARIKDLIKKESLEVYPYFGKNCLELTNTLADTISKSEISLKNKIENLAMLPSWVQMYTYGNWISKRIGISFESSIGYVVKVLKLCVKELTTENNTEEMITTSDNSEALKILKKHNISLKNINQRNETGETNLIKYCRKGNFEVVSAMLKVGAVTVNDTCFGGWTALHEAVTSRRLDIVQMLLKYKPSNSTLKPIDVFASNPLNKVTALHDAALANNFEMCGVLVKHGGARLVEMETIEGKKAIDLTTDNNIKNYFNETLKSNYSFSFCRKQKLLNLEAFDIMLLREFTFSCIDVFGLREVLVKNELKVKNATIILEEIDRDIKIRYIKVDIERISQNINSLEELKRLLKEIIDHHSNTILFYPLNDWFICLE